MSFMPSPGFAMCQRFKETLKQFKETFKRYKEMLKHFKQTLEPIRNLVLG